MLILEIPSFEEELRELYEKTQALDNKWVKIGVFASSGVNEDGYNYASILDFLSKGNAKRHIVPRPILDIMFDQHPISSEDNGLNNVLRAYYRSSSMSPNYVFEAVGTYYRGQMYNLFGNTKYIKRNTPDYESYKVLNGYPASSPMIATGKLQSLSAYQIKGQPVKEFG